MNKGAVGVVIVSNHPHLALPRGIDPNEAAGPQWHKVSVQWMKTGERASELHVCDMQDKIEAGMRAYSACSLSSLIHPCCFGDSGAGWPGEPGSKLIAGQLLGNADVAADVPCSSCPAAPNDPSSNRGAGSDLPRARVSAFTASSSLLMLLLFVSPRDCAVSRSNLETREEAVRFGECLALGTAPSNKRGSSNSETVAEALLLLLRVHMHADTHIIALVTWLYPWLNTVAHICGVNVCVTTEGAYTMALLFET